VQVKSKIRLDRILSKENNNLGLFRLLAAILVIWSHAYALTYNPQGEDFIFALTGFVDSGGIAVKFFFFISGILVTNSLVRGSSPNDFISARFFRVWPALFVCVALLTLVIGPLATDQSGPDYFGNSATWQFLLSNSVTSPIAGWASSSLTLWYLPGLFTDLPLRAVNGSLWTIPYEVVSYLALFGIWFVWAQVRRFLTLALVVYLLLTYLIPAWTFLDSSYTILLLLFFLGAALAIWQNRIYIGIWLLLPLLLSSVLLVGSKLGHVFLFITFFMAIIWISSFAQVKKIRLPGDYSYGTYLWGWPVQQLVTQLGVTTITFQNQLLVIAISVGLGALSWHFVEKPSMKFGKRLALNFRSRSK
jgi:peptidoglycan/LPS O-acetylase OafA/YrhL